MYIRKRRYGRRRFGMLRRKRRVGRVRPRRRFYRARRRRFRRSSGGKEWKRVTGTQANIGCNHAFAAINLTSGIPVGTGPNQRIGSKITIRKLEVWYNMYGNTTITQQTCRLVIWRLRNFIANAPASLANIFDTIGGGLPSSIAVATGKVGRNHDWSVIYKGANVINPVVNAATVYPQGRFMVGKYVCFRWRRGLRVTYNDGADVYGLNKCNQLQADMFGTDWLGAAPGSQPDGNLFWIVWFTDD